MEPFDLRMRRWLHLAAFVCLAWLTGGLRVARSEDPPPPRFKLGHCGCKEGKACWHFLRSPMRPPEDPCVCGLCLAKGDCSTNPKPDKWSADCAGSQKPECFWKRHASSWGISCARCALDEECTACDLPGAPDGPKKATLAKQFALEFGDPVARRKACVGWSRHFYCASDIPALKVLTQSGAPRVVDAHEIVHLFLQRAEIAYDDFVAVWGDQIRLDKPMAIYLAQKTVKKDAWRAAYFGAGKAEMVYAGAEGKIAGGFCWNGFAASHDEYSDDRDLHAYCRHMIGHILFSCWHGVGGKNKECPRWAFVGAADWLCKIHAPFEDWTTFCQEEGGSPGGNGKDWDQKARQLAATKRTPIETLFAIASMSHLSIDDYVRSWSYMDVMLREDRTRWLSVFGKIREGKDFALAFREGLGMTPEDFDLRWADRMLGKRKTMADVPKDAASAAALGSVDAQERRRIQRETDPATLASLIRGLDKLRDVETAKLVVSKIAVDSDGVREACVLVLQNAPDPAVVAWLRAEGITDSNSVARALVARALGRLKDAAARPALEAALDDSFWLVRANAATALASIADPASGKALAAKIDDSNAKAWIAKADALMSFGSAGTPVTKAVVARLTSREWQARLTAYRALATFGDVDAVEPLMDRLDAEGGRLAREALKALRAVTHENFGANVQTWRTWWKSQKPRGLPPPPAAPPPPNPEDERYAKPKARPGSGQDEEPTYYGRRIFSQSVVFVIDLSRSMETVIEVPAADQEKLGTIGVGKRIAVAKAAARSAIAKLDPRVRFNIVFFSTEVHPWRDGLVPLGGERAGAESAIESAVCDGETNIFGALRAAFGLHEKPTLSADLDAVPDAIYFMTDGTPTNGEILETEAILSWAHDFNRFAKCELNVIAMGSLGIDLNLLRRLATENGGVFIHVPDRK